MSQFLNSSKYFTEGQPSGIDFEKAVKLPAGGSTCIVYRTRWQRREVFVKRLKEEYRNNPLYLDAFDKEFDVGVNLKHPSLPEYREFHRDYIVMDYIDGVTLGEMVKEKDPWLNNEKHVKQLLRELVEVVDYLHRHNIMHCDIKPANIMVTAKTKHLVLIDFDKSYTDALNDTSGNPIKYGLDEGEKGNTAIDFYGIGMVAEKLKDAGFSFNGYKTFVKACRSEGVNCEELLAILCNNASRFKRNTLLILFSIIVSGGVAGYLVYDKLERGKREDVSDEIPVTETEDSLIQEVDETSRDIFTEDRHAGSKVIDKETEKIDNREGAESVADEGDEELSELTDEIDTVILSALDEKVKPYFDDIITGLAKLEKAMNDPTLTVEKLDEYWAQYQMLEMKKLEEMIPVVADFEENNPGTKVSRLINSTKSCRAYLSRAQNVKSQFLTEIDRRQK